MSNCTAISAFAPSIFAKSIFAPRRADKSIEADSMPVSIMNASVAALQLAKAGEGIVGIAQDSKGTLASKIVDIDTALREIPKDSVFKDLGKAANYGMKHINGIIGLTTLANIACSDDKETALVVDGSTFGGMLAFEGAHKAIFGSSSSDRKNGQNQIKINEGLYRKSKYLSKKADSFKALCAKQAEALEDCGAVKRFIGKAIKYAPPGIKGLSFAGTSILGCVTCRNIAEDLVAKNDKQAKVVEMKPEQKAKEVSLNTLYRKAV